MNKFKILFLMLCAIISIASCSDSDDYGTEQKKSALASIDIIDKIAINFANNVHDNYKTRGSNKDSIFVTNKDSLTLGFSTRTSDIESTKLYTVSMAGENGTIIIAQKGDSIRPIVYFPDERNVNLNDIYNKDNNESEISYMAQGATYNYTEDGILIPSDKASNAKIVERLEPKCKVYWHQDSPYNKYCFTKNNEHAKAGCVAIAGAQAMTVLRPRTPLISSWDEVIKTNPSKVAQNQIARLISRIGKDAGMDYGTKESGTKTENLSPIFAQYDIQDYDAERAIDVLKTEHGIIIVSGYRARHGWGPTKHYVDGHAFIADGYIRFSGDKYYYLHVNYGWGLDSRKAKEQKSAYLLTSNKVWDETLANGIYDMYFPKKIKYFTYTYKNEKNW